MIVMMNRTNKKYEKILTEHGLLESAKDAEEVEQERKVRKLKRSDSTLKERHNDSYYDDDSRFQSRRGSQLSRTQKVKKVPTCEQSIQTKFFLDEGPRRVYNQAQTDLGGADFHKLMTELNDYKTKKLSGLFER